jgi:hypothetical protein
VRYLATSPADRCRKLRRWERRVEEIVRQVFAADLPAAVAYITRRAAS